MDCREIDLRRPVDAGQGAVKKLTMREPKVRDLLACEKAGKSDAEREIRLFANLCEVAPGVIEELSLCDYAALQEAYRGFLS